MNEPKRFAYLIHPMELGIDLVIGNWIEEWNEFIETDGEECIGIQ